MRVAIAFGLGLFALLAAAPAQALTLANHDPDAHTLTVKENGKSRELTVNPNAQLDLPCDPTCVIDLAGEQYEMQSRDQASIEKGIIFLDAAPGDGGAQEDTATIPDDPDSDDTGAAPADGAK